MQIIAKYEYQYKRCKEKNQVQICGCRGTQIKRNEKKSYKRSERKKLMGTDRSVPSPISSGFSYNEVLEVITH